MHQMQKTIRFITIFCTLCVKMMLPAQAQTAEYRDVVINEIMADPSPVIGLPEREFVEIFNRSNKTLDLTGWTIKDASTSRGTFPSATLAPGAYAIICKSADAGLFTPYGQVIIASTLPSLNNDADSVIIRNAAGELIDAVYYRDSWYGDAVKKNGGYTLELINPALSCSGSANWVASNNASGGTPGTANSVLNNTPDVTAPSVLSHTLTAEDIVTITFSEAVDIITAENPNLYEFSPEVIVQSVTFDSDRKVARLNLDGRISAGVMYQLKIFGISDCEGNNMAETTLNIFLGESAAYNDLIITEIMADPTPVVKLPEEEYIEIYNRSSKAIDLKGLSFTAGTRTGTFTEGQLASGEYAVVVPVAAVGSFSSAPKVIGLTGFPALTNSGADLSIKNSNGELIYQITFSDAWYATSSKKEGGWSLEMVDVTQPCAGRENWKESVDAKGGTPGAVNSVNGTINAPVALKPAAVEYLSNNVIQVIFSGKFNLSMLNDIQITTTPDLSINAITPILPGADRIEIAFQDVIPEGIVYDLSIRGFYDCSGIAMEPATLKFGVPVLVEQGDIVINELMYDPKTGGEDFVEILNISDKLISLSDMVLTREDAAGSKITTTKLENYRRIIFPGDYTVLSAKGESIRGQYTTPGAGPFVDVSGFPGYINDGGVVGLYRKDDTLLDRFAYDPKMHFKLLDITKGVSLERVNPKIATSERSNWNSAAVSIGGATPGYQNSQYLQPVPKGDLSVSPEVFSPDSDGIDDVLGVSFQLDKTGYVGAASVYTLEGIPVRKLFTQQTLAQEGFFTWNGLDDQDKKARVGIYIIVLEVFDLDGNKDLMRAKCVVASRNR